MKILIVSETVTLAHLLRLIPMARQLQDENHEVHLAYSQCPEFLKSELRRFKTLKLSCYLDPQKFDRALHTTGFLPIDEPYLEASYNENISLIHNIQPDLVIGDFRFTLGDACATANVKYIAVSDYHWHPQQPWDSETADTIWSRYFGVAISTFFFQHSKPMAWFFSSLPYKRWQMKKGLKLTGSLLNQITAGQINLYASLRELYEPIATVQSNEFFYGPSLYSFQPSTPLPDWPQGQKRILISLGSSGDYRSLKTTLRAIQKMGHSTIVTGTDESKTQIESKNIKYISFVDIKTLIGQADLLINNGGSPTGYLSLAQQCPLLCLPSNTDQHMFTTRLEKKNLALKIRAEKATEKSVSEAIEDILGNNKYKKASAPYAEAILKIDQKQKLKQIMTQL